MTQAIKVLPSQTVRLVAEVYSDETRSLFAKGSSMVSLRPQSAVNWDIDKQIGEIGHPYHL